MNSSLAAPPQKTILVVEDTALVLKTVCMILERAKFTVLAAASARDAALARATLALTLTDELPNTIVTPHNSGWTAGMVRRRWDEIADNIGRFVRGDSLINLVTKT